mgnify:CR=1 FL=1|jgi:hypothetical protein
MKKVLLVLSLSLAFNTLSAQEMTHDVIYENSDLEHYISLSKFEQVIDDYHFLQYSLSGRDRLTKYSIYHVYFKLDSKNEMINFIEELILTKNNEVKTFSVGYAISMGDYVSVYDTDINRFINITTKELSDILEALKQ